MSTVADLLRKAAPNMNAGYRQAFEQGGDLLQSFGITTPLRLCHFLAQVLHETGGGTVTFESLRYKTPERLLEIFGAGHHTAAIRPDEVADLLGNQEKLAERVYGLGNPRKAKELGNTAPGDGFRYRGGGLLQTTGGANYRRMGEKSGVNFYAHPDLIVAPEHALKPALHEWEEGNLNAAADRNDILAITKKVNGGKNGLHERQAWFDKLWALAGDGARDPSTVAAVDEDTEWLQQALNDLGAQPRLDVDGRYGPGTKAAVRWFQTVAGLAVDGVAGEMTRAEIRDRLAAFPPAA